MMTSGTSPGFIQRKLWLPLLGQLKQGISPEKLASSVAWAGVLGIFPILGATTGLCLIVGQWKKLNQVALQTINYLITPLHLLLIPIFIKIGEKFFGLNSVTFDPRILVPEFFASPGVFFQRYGASALSGISVWAIVAYPLYRLLFSLFSVFLKKRTSP
ncbi:MAG: DUF2062 domain-containing protein [Cryobacterium sp.]|nr:DUF2062 domain-containing protein [Oligoflexia bacterium]